MEDPFLEFTLSSDTWSPAHPAMVQAIADASVGFAPPYGEDGMTRAAVNAFKNLFGQEIEVFFAFSGTGANVAALAALAGRASGVVCANSAHIHVHEAGAPEKLLGIKLLACPASAGKLLPEQIEQAATTQGDPHFASPDVVSIAQCTEMGTVYSLAELQALCSTAHRHNMLVHMDGARFANAVAALGCSPAAIARDAGVDALCFGGTKNGFIFGEAIVFFNKNAAKRFAHLQKQHLQMASKNRFIAAQFLAALKNSLWLQLAGKANAMATRLANALATVPGAQPLYPPDANMVFVKLPETLLAPLASLTNCDIEEGNIARLVTSWNTTEAQVDGFVERLKKHL